MFIGAISSLKIYDSNSSVSYPSNYSDFISYYTNLYENYWDLTTNTTFDGTHVLNSCLRYLEYGASELYFGGYRPQTPPIPTDNGWIQLYAPSDFTIWADSVPFGNAHQLTVQFDMFSIHRKSIIFTF